MDRGTHALKGVPKPTTLFRIARASSGRRFGARALTPLVGREEELDLLRRRWERAARGEGQFVQIVCDEQAGHLTLHPSCDHHRAWLSQRLDARGNVGRVAEDLA
jgi:hypothetical protein